jgi:hypothetical protein
VSPYERVLGPAAERLHPRLRAYFAEIPPGSVGIGRGVFDTVGTPRRWLHPVVRAVGGGALFPVWATDVPFTVVNRAEGDVVHAVRRVRVGTEVLTMRDATSASRAGIVDRIGVPTRLTAAFFTEVGADGELLLTSHRVHVTLAGLGLRLPGWIAPRIRLVERFDEAAGRQRVAITVDAPVLGRIYEYGGTFAYRVVQDPGAFEEEAP